MPKGTGQIEFFTAVMDEVLVPENIDMMIQSMYPIRSKINTNKCDNKELPAALKTVDGYFIDQPWVGNQDQGKAECVFEDISKT